MRSLLLAAVLLFAGAPAFAQSGPSETDRAEQELRSSLAPAGGAVDRVAPDEIRLNMPSDITFDFDRANVRREFMPALRNLARTLRAHPAMAVGVVGHTDALGSDAYNQNLSERRARAVSIALEQYDVPDERIVATGMGEMAPIASNATEDGRAQNRRVEISLKMTPKY